MVTTSGSPSVVSHSERWLSARPELHFSLRGASGGARRSAAAGRLYPRVLGEGFLTIGICVRGLGPEESQDKCRIFFIMRDAQPGSNGLNLEIKYSIKTSK